ncbi:DNA polymerase [Lysobacter soli]|uniref:DNA polymerase Y family protein n=1 Tax=Lysobacter soli TaxID=453783 RepID=UPI0012EDD0AE|nr:DNA polymerase [Lysobacter soli]QGW66288.1 DNA polymerase [Lysobacter soli]
MTLRCLFVDFNSYFASVEQYDEPALLGRPVAVVPVMSATTCAIAASYEAKAFGVKTGTPVWEALELCPDIVLREARPARYIAMHHRLMAAIEECIPHGKAESIDEVPCWLIGRERERANAEAIAKRIKQRLVDEGFSPAIRCSIGIAPNRFLAKTASDMRKPDGLTVLEEADLPGALHSLALREFCGIGPSVEQRLLRAGIHTSEQLCAASRSQLRAAWGSIEGERYWLQLRGHELPGRTERRASLGHSHVLGPELRTFEGARAVLFKLLAKAAMRLRHERYLAGGLSIRIRFVGMENRFERDLTFAPLDDTPTLLRLLGDELASLETAIQRKRWNARRHPPLSVAVTLTQLEPVGSITQELMATRGRAKAISATLDSINRRYGNNTLYFGAMQEALEQDAAPMRIPFATIPEAGLEEDVAARSKPTDSVEELWLERERQFKVLAEEAHRKAREQPERIKAVTAKPFGAGGWTRGTSKEPPAAPGTTGSLF